MPPLPPTKELERPACMVTLGLLPPYMAEDVEKAYLARIKEIRPDLGGDPQPFYEVQIAYMQAKEYVKFRGDGAVGSPGEWKSTLACKRQSRASRSLGRRSKLIRWIGWKNRS